jgi:hypothetical protein
MPSRPEESRGADVSLGIEPSDAELEAEWAAHERERREAWLRSRRLGVREATFRLPAPDPEVALVVAQRYMRECQLAAEGAISLLFKTSARDVLDNLVRAGREWEEEYTSQPVRRRRVASGVDTGGSSTSTGTGSSGASSQPS